MNQILRNNKYRILFVVLSILVFLPLVANISRGLNYCFNPHDFGILLQAMMGIAESESWNPYVSIVQVPIFNDHFDPGLILSTWPLALFKDNVSAALFGEWQFYFYSVLFVAWMHFKRGSSVKKIVLAISFFIFSRTMLQGITFPIHAGTMAIFPLVLMTYFLVNAKRSLTTDILVVLCVLLSSSFRESIPFILIPSSFIFLLARRYRQFALVILPSIVWLIIYSFRAKILGGAAVDYGESTLGLLLTSPIDLITVLFRSLASFTYKPLIPLLIVTAAIFVEKKRLNISLMFSLLLIFFGVMLHAVIGRLVHHHYISFSVTLMTVLAFYDFSDFKNKYAKVIFIVGMISLVGVASGPYTKMVKNLATDSNYGHKSCSKNKTVSFNELENFAKTLPEKSTVFGTGSALLPFIIQKHHVYDYVFYRSHPANYSYAVLDKNPNGDMWPTGQGLLKRVFEKCALEKNIIFENKDFKVWKGPLVQSCLEVREHASNKGMKIGQ